MKFWNSLIQDTANSLTREWLETNGKGGFASSTITGAHSRKYHSWLVVKDKINNRRINLISKIDASICLDQVWEMGTNQYPFKLHPEGYKLIQKFEQDLFPQTTYEIDGKAVLEQSLQLIHGEETLVICYRNLGKKDFRLRLSPFVNPRDIHAVARRNAFIDVKVKAAADTKEGKVFAKNFVMKPYPDIPIINFSLQANFKKDPRAGFYGSPSWVENLEYLEEQRRGHDYREDLLIPGLFDSLLPAGEELFLAVSVDKLVELPSTLWKKELKRKETLQRAQKTDNSYISQLKVVADQFLVNNSFGKTSIIAGYPWFVEWGRDAMISLPGLTFCRGLLKEGLDVLRGFAQFEKSGLIPNYLPESEKGEVAYNSVDAPFWFFWALQQYVHKTADYKTVWNDFSKTMESIIENFLSDRVPFVSMKRNGLLWCGHEGTNLTWMDGVCGTLPATPRHGMPVEINALWYNALSFYLELCHLFKKAPVDGSVEVLKELNISFVKNFWSESIGALADCINEERKDFSIRPNQVIATAMTYSPLSVSQKESILSQVEEELLTAEGLKTLNERDQKYRPFYYGNEQQRSAAYHNGTIWTWLLGPYFETCWQLSAKDEKAKNKIQDSIICFLEKHLNEAGIGQVSEIFQADRPHLAKGCIAQAWSVAELIRIWDLTEENLVSKKTKIVRKKKS